jgi:pimeloyl-ACP methyl ester carboxylesterase
VTDGVLGDHGSVGLLSEETGPADAQVVALVHGGMDRSTSFFKVVRRLDDLRVLRYDRRGYAKNLSVPGPYTIGQHADDLLGLLAGRPAVVVGHSLGGVIALTAAQRAPEVVRAVGVYEAPMSWMPWHTSTYARDSVGEDVTPEMAAERFLRRALGDGIWERIPERTKRERRAEGHCLVSELRDVRRAAPYDPAVLVALGVPVRSAYGTASAPHLQRAAQELAALTGTEPVVFEDARHGAHSSHPDLFAGFVRGLVALAAARP